MFYKKALKKYGAYKMWSINNKNSKKKDTESFTSVSL